MKKDLSELTNEEISDLSEEIEKEFREEVVEEWSSALGPIEKLDEKYEEHKKIYGSIAKLETDWREIGDIIFWFTMLRLFWKARIEEAISVLGDALTIAPRKSLYESISYVWEHEDLELDAGKHELVDLVITKVRERGFKAYRKKKGKKRRILPYEKIQELRKEGLTIREISTRLKIPKSTIQDALRR